MRSALKWLLLLGILAAAALYIRDYIQRYPQNLPWTELDLNQPVGWFTGRKLAALGDEPAKCRALIRNADVGDVAVPPRTDSGQCGYDDGMRLGGERDARVEPEGLVASCPVAAALVLFDREVLQVAALRHFNSKVTALDHAGSYSCRRLYGRNEGRFSEHATANAIDITGVRLSDGTRISVMADWSSPGPKQAFLKEVRDGACKLFATVLSPDYNAAHADHLHLDQAGRGRFGGTLCR